MTTIAALPTPPDRNDAANFSAASDTFFEALPTYGTQVSAVLGEVTGLPLAAASYGSGIESGIAFSSTSFTLGGATATLTVNPYKNFTAGLLVTVVSGSNYFTGSVTSYSGTTLVISVTQTVGSGTYSTWVIARSGDTRLGVPADIALTDSTLDLRGVGNSTVVVTGTAAITTILVYAGQCVTVVAGGNFSLTYNELTCNLAGYGSYTTTIYDVLQVVGDASGIPYVSISPQSGIPLTPFGNTKGIFGYGQSPTTALTNTVNTSGIVSSDITGVGTARMFPSAASYGGDKAIFAYGFAASYSSLSNLVSNTGVVATDTAGVGTARYYAGAAGYGVDKALVAYGWNGGYINIINQISNAGVVATDTTSVGTTRYGIAGASYGGDKGILAYGYNSTVYYAISNLISNTGVIASNGPSVGTGRYYTAGTGYGRDKAMFGYGNASGSAVAVLNLVSNTGIVSADSGGVGTARYALAATEYGGDKAIFGYGQTGAGLSMTNLVSSVGLVTTDVAGVGTARSGLAAASFANS